MATIPNPASPKFPDVYQIETSDPVQGGPNGVSNKSTKDLVERTQYLNLNKANTTTKIVAGSGLTGGGTLGSDTTVTLGTPGELTDKSNNAVTETGHTHSLQKSSTVVAGIVQLNDTLTSDSNALALTAKQGKVLKAQVDKAISFFTADEALPTTNIGPIWHEKYASIMEWVVFSLNGAKYTGYASVGIGIVTADSQPTLRTGYIRSGAASYNQATYPILWNWAKHNGLVQNAATWKAKTGFYRDNGDGTFTPPDLTDQHIRFSGAGREVGAYQGDAMRNISGSFRSTMHGDNLGMIIAAGGAFKGRDVGTAPSVPAWAPSEHSRFKEAYLDLASQVPISSEFQVVTTAFLPAIKH